MGLFPRHCRACWGMLAIILCCNSLSSYCWGDSSLRNDRGFQTRRTSGKRINATVSFKTFEEVLEKFHDEPVVVYFGTSSCGPCRQMKKEVARLKELVGEQMRVFSVDTEKWPLIGPRFEIVHVPALAVFCEGKVILRLEGVSTAASIVEQVKSLL